MSDAFAELISAGFHQQEAHRIIDSQRERYALIDTVLSGHDQPTATLWQAIDRIGFPRDRPFTVVAVETAGMARVPTHRIESLLRDHDMESAWMLRSDVELGVVSCFGEQIPGLRASVEHFRVRAGISPVFTDFGNAPHAVRLARTALAAAPKGRVLYFADSAIGTMAAGAPDVASELTSIVLYGLLEMPKQERDVILDTVRTWFGASGSVAETARSMFVHPNTVRNRLRRLEVLTMRRLSDPRQAAEIYLAIVSLSQ